MFYKYQFKTQETNSYTMYVQIYGRHYLQNDINSIKDANSSICWIHGNIYSFLNCTSR